MNLSIYAVREVINNHYENEILYLMRISIKISHFFEQSTNNNKNHLKKDIAFVLFLFNNKNMVLLE